MPQCNYGFPVEIDSGSANRVVTGQAVMSTLVLSAGGPICHISKSQIALYAYSVPDRQAWGIDALNMN